MPSELPNSGNGAAFAQTVELLRRNPRLTRAERKELRRLLSELSANELLALQAVPEHARGLWRLDLMRQRGWRALLAVGVLILILAGVLWLFLSPRASVLFWEDPNSTAELGTWHG